MTRIFWTVFALSLLGCNKSVAPAVPSQASARTISEISIQRQKLALIRADMREADKQLVAIDEEIISMQHLPQCMLNPASCSTSALEAIRSDTEDELADLHDQLRIEGHKLQLLIDTLVGN